MPSRELVEHRKLHARIATQRDGGLCVIHYFTKNSIVPAQDAHHMFGRGIKVDDHKENYTRIISVCRECHPQPILVPTTAKYEIIYAWLMANITPIEKSFQHPIKFSSFSSDILSEKTWDQYLEYYESTNQDLEKSRA